MSEMSNTERQLFMQKAAHIAELERKLALASGHRRNLSETVQRLELSNAQLITEQVDYTYRIQQLERENAELKRYLALYDQSDKLTTEPELRKALIETGKERDQLRLQVVRLREALTSY